VTLVLLALYPTPAVANDSLGGLGPGALPFLPVIVGALAIGGLLVMAGYLLVIVAVEAGVVNRLLEIGYGKAFELTLLANFVSTLFGLVCRFAVGEMGWKSAVAEGRYERVLVLLLRSFLVTLALEAFVLLGSLGREQDPRQTLKATVAANGVSYLLIAALMVLLRALP
jgi:hypothetical protein